MKVCKPKLPMKNFLIKNANSLAFRQAYFLLANRIQNAFVGQTGEKIIAITTANAGTGATSTALNLCSTLSMNGNKVLYIDLNKSNDNIAATFDNIEKPVQGISDAISLDNSLQNYIIKSNFFDFDILPYGSSIFNISKQTKLTPTWLTAICSDYEWTILDLPSFEESSDIFPLSEIVKNVLLVAKENVTKKKNLLMLSSQLISSGFKLLGCNYIK